MQHPLLTHCVAALPLPTPAARRPTVHPAASYGGTRAAPVSVLVGSEPCAFEAHSPLPGHPRALASCPPPAVCAAGALLFGCGSGWADPLLTGSHSGGTRSVSFAHFSAATESQDLCVNRLGRSRQRWRCSVPRMLVVQPGLGPMTLVCCIMIPGSVF